MILKLRRKSLAPFLVVALLLLGTACGGQEGTTPSPAATVAATPLATPPTATAAPTPSARTTVASAVDGEATLRHVLALAQEIGPRPAGSPSEARATQYIAQQLRSYGYQVQEQEFQFPQREDLATLEVLSPVARTLNPVPLTRSGEGSVSAALVAAGLGHAQDFPAQGLNGAIALVERGEVTFSEKAANAVAAGASAVVIYNNQPGLFQGILQTTSRVPVVAISREEGQETLRLLGQGPVRATVSARTREVTITSRNVLARPPDGRCLVIVGGHHDSVPIAPGGNDNASGTATVLEVARVAAAEGITSGACFATFGAEELGLLGSQHLVASLTQEEKRLLRGMINLDVVGAGNRWVLIGSSALVDLALQGAQALGVAAQRGNLPPGTGSDHQSFIGAGIPAVFITLEGSPPIHTPQDTAALVQPRLLAEAAQIALHVLRRLTGGER